MSTATRLPILATFWAGQTDGTWENVADVWDRPMRPLDPIRFLRASRGRKAVLLLGSVTLNDRYRDLVFALVIKFLTRKQRRPRVVLSDATWEPRSRALERRLPALAPFLPAIVRAVVRSLDGEHVRYGVLSTAEAESFTQRWGVPRERVAVTLFPVTLASNEISRLEIRDDGYVFAGGDSLRDYDLLLRALDLLGNPPAVIAAHWEPDRPRPGLRTGPVPHWEFLKLMAHASVCVVPLAHAERSAGQQTYLNSMLLGKPTIVTDGPGVRDYIDHDETAFISAPDPASLARAIRSTTTGGSPTAVRDVTERGARVAATRFTVVNYRLDLIRLCGISL